MQFDSVSEFLAMGGHGLYVWLAYGSTFSVLLVNVLLLRQARLRQWQRLRWSAQVEVTKKNQMVEEVDVE